MGHIQRAAAPGFILNASTRSQASPAAARHRQAGRRWAGPSLKTDLVRSTELGPQTTNRRTTTAHPLSFVSVGTSLGRIGCLSDHPSFVGKKNTFYSRELELVERVVESNSSGTKTPQRQVPTNHQIINLKTDNNCANDANYFTKSNRHDYDGSGSQPLHCCIDDDDTASGGGTLFGGRYLPGAIANLLRPPLSV